MTRPLFYLILLTATALTFTAAYMTMYTPYKWQSVIIAVIGLVFTLCISDGFQDER